jgi:hypothetical protein
MSEMCRQELIWTRPRDVRRISLDIDLDGQLVELPGEAEGRQCPKIGRLSPTKSPEQGTTLRASS